MLRLGAQCEPLNRGESDRLGPPIGVSAVREKLIH